MHEEIFAKGKLFELVHVTQPDGRVFEIARRAPGVRLIISDKENEKVLLTKEFCQELDGWDFRLPGGKVFDSLEEYEAHRATAEDMLPKVLKKGVQEGREEAGLEIQSLHLFRKSTLGATVEWDLFVMEVDAWEHAPEGQALEEGEKIEAEAWLSYAEVEKLIFDGGMQEERVALILLRWIAQQKGGQL